MAQLEITETRTVEATLLMVEAGVWYWEDASVNGVEDEDGTLIPCRIGDAWCPTIEIDTGIIRDWPAGTTAKIHYKVCDAGEYILADDGGKTLHRKEGYVPSIMSPGGSGYGDYIIMDVADDGKIANWTVDLSSFESDDE